MPSLHLLLIVRPGILRVLCLLTWKSKVGSRKKPAEKTGASHNYWVNVQLTTLLELDFLRWKVNLILKIQIKLKYWLVFFIYLKEGGCSGSLVSVMSLQQRIAEKAPAELTWSKPSAKSSLVLNPKSSRKNNGQKFRAEQIKVQADNTKKKAWKRTNSI